jgi:hypothetical protein
MRVLFFGSPIAIVMIALACSEAAAHTQQQGDRFHFVTGCNAAPLPSSMD